MTPAKRGLRLRIKFTLIVISVVITGMLSIAFLATHSVEQLIRESVEKQLIFTNRLVIDLIEANLEGARLATERLGHAFSEHFRGQYRLVSSRTDHTMVLTLDGAPVTDLNEQIDQFSESAGGHVATIFMRDGEDFRRVATSLRREDESRAVGTLLGKNHPAYSRLMAGKAYIGQAFLFGRYYMTMYQPILDRSTSPIAVQFVGVELSSNIESIREKVRQFRFGDSGYAFIVDSRPGADYGRFVVHPAKEGALLAGDQAIKAILSQKTGLLHYHWQNQELGERVAREKTAALAEYPAFNWVVGTSAYLDDSVASVREGLKLLIIGAVSLTVLIIVALNVGIGRLVLRPLESMSQRLTKANRTLRVLSLCNETLVHATTEQELLDRIVKLLTSVEEYRSAWIAFGGLDPDSPPTIAAQAGDESLYMIAVRDRWHVLGHESQPPYQCQKAGEAQVIHDCLESAAQELNDAARQGWLRSLIAYPLMNQGKSFGCLVIESDQINVFDQEATQLLTELSEDLAFGILTLCNEEARREAEGALELSNRAIESSSEGILIAAEDQDHFRILYANPASSSITGCSNEQLLGLTLPEIVGDAEEIQALLRQRSGTSTYLNKRTDGTTYWCETSLWPVSESGGNTRHLVCVVKDVSKRIAYEQQLARQAYYDPLTGLPNRNLLSDRLDQQIAWAQRHGESFAVAFLDLDHFKYVNDSLGHQIGDNLLVEVAERIASSIRDVDTLSRQGGDEFVLIFPDIGHEGNLLAVLKRIQDALREPFKLADREFHISASIGISLYPKDGANQTTLLRHADIAMYRAKDSGRNTTCYFAEDMNTRLQQRMGLVEELHYAIARDELYLCYQPQVDLSLDATIGVEALLRWRHPQLGEVSPGQFIPVAEESGLISSIGKWVLQQACRDAKCWQDAGYAGLRVAVNVSARQFDEDLPQLVAEVLRETGLSGSNLELEITESLLMDKPDEIRESLRLLSDMGVNLSLDDFGTGYSSLAYLTQFSLDTLKIDQSFVRNIVGNSDARAIAKTIIAMAHSLGMTPLAEGVETQEQLEVLRELGCQCIQGYFFSRPIKLELLLDWLETKPFLELLTADQLANMT